MATFQLNQALLLCAGIFSLSALAAHASTQANSGSGTFRFIAGDYCTEPSSPVESAVIKRADCITNGLDYKFEQILPDGYYKITSADISNLCMQFEGVGESPTFAACNATFKDQQWFAQPTSNSYYVLKDHDQTSCLTESTSSTKITMVACEKNYADNQQFKTGLNTDSYAVAQSYLKLLSHGSSGDASGASRMDKVKDATQDSAAAVAAATASGSTGQLGALGAATSVNTDAAAYLATMATLHCGEGANFSLAGNPSASQSMASCQSEFAAANEMKKNATALIPDPNVLAYPESELTLSNFKKNFGVEPDDFMRRMVNSRGSMSELSGMLNSKFNEGQLATLTSSSDLGGASSSFSAASGILLGTLPSSGPAKDSTRSKLREKIRQQLSATSSPGRKLATVDASEGFKATESNKLQEKIFDLSASQAGDIEIALAAPTALVVELTLFDVIHEKYAGLHRRMSKP